MSDVFVPHLPLRFDHATGKHVPSVDINPAARYGELVILSRGRFDQARLSADNLTVNTNFFVAARRFDPELDFLLMTGDMTLTGLFMSYLWNAHPKYRVLRWDRGMSDYETLTLEKTQ